MKQKDSFYLAFKITSGLLRQIVYALMMFYCTFSVKNNAELLLGMENIQYVQNGELSTNLNGNFTTHKISGPWSLLFGIYYFYHDNNISSVVYKSFDNLNNVWTDKSHKSISFNDMMNIDNLERSTIDKEIINQYNKIIVYHDVIVVFIIILIIITGISYAFKVFSFCTIYVYSRYHAISNFINTVVYVGIKFIMLLIFVIYLHNNDKFINMFDNITHDPIPPFIKKLDDDDFTVLYIVIVLNALSSITQIIQKTYKYGGVKMVLGETFKKGYEIIH